MGKAKTPGYLKPRNGRAGGPPWRAALCVAGRVHWFGARTEPTLKHGTKNDAIEWMGRKLAELKKAAKREEVGLPGRVRFSELLQQYRSDLVGKPTRKSYESTLRAAEHYFVEQHGDPMLDQIGRGHIKLFLSWRRSHGPDGTALTTLLGSRSFNKERGVLHQLFGFGEESELCETNPVRHVKKIKHDPHRSVILSTEQYEALVQACEPDPMVRLYVLLLGEAGVRDESEALWLRWEDVDFERGFVTIVSGRDGHRTKSGKSRFVPMTDRLKKALQDHFATYRLSGISPWIFFHERTRRHHLRGARVHSLRGAVHNAVVRANAALQRERRDPIPEGWRMHDLRHRRVTTWLAEGQNVTAVQAWLGHSAISTTMLYFHYLPQHLRPVEDAAPVLLAAVQQQGGGR
jgi:integrase/recombinase XerC